jgi:hypothetical protein
MNIETKLAGHSARVRGNYHRLKCNDASLTLLEVVELVFLGLAEKIVEDQEYYVAN